MENQLPAGPGYFESGAEHNVNPWHLVDQAFGADIKMTTGHAVLVTGLIMAKNMSAGGNTGKVMPYVPDTYDAMTANPYLVAGRTFLAADIADGATTLTVPIKDSYRFAAGDEICVDDDGSTTPENLGAIVSIDQTTSSIIATITFTNPVTASAGFDVANSGCCYVNGSKSALLASDMAAAVNQVDTVTMTGTSGTATVAGPGGLSFTATFNSDLTTTNSDFVTANAPAYLARGIVLTSSTDTLIFTAHVAGSGHTAPTAVNASGNLAGTNVATTANVDGVSVVVTNANAKGFAVGQILYAASDTVDAAILGAITAIAKGATNTTITVTNVPAGSYTTAQNALAYVMGTTLQTAYCILKAERITGYGELSAYGSTMGVGVFKNAMAYTNMLGNIDDKAIVALGALEIEDKLII